MRDLQGLLARLFDVLMIVGGAAVASQIRFEYIEAHTYSVAFVAFAAAFSLALFPGFGVYQSWRGRSKLQLACQVSLGWLVVQGCALALMFSLHRLDYVSRLWFAYWTAMSGGLMIAGRLITHAILAHMRNAGLNLQQVAIVGCGRHCDSMLRKIERSQDTGFRMCAAFNAAAGKSRLNTRLPVYDDFDAFVAFVRAQNVHEVWLALPLSEEPTILRFVNEFRDDLINVRFIPDVRSLALFESGVTDLLGQPAINLVATPLSASAQLQKEIFDRLFALGAIIAVSPALICIALAIKLTSRGPVLFRQNRKGADGRVFTIYKFRSMRLHTEQAGVLRQATRNDPRVTRVGAFLRRTSLDELPQFFNVLRGDMSVVGPRPHALEHDDLYQKVVSGYIHRYRIKPGITGWAQVNGFRGETDRIEKMEGRVAHDLYYLGNWSFGLDMRIIAATIFKGLRHTNAY
ncbi:MULTISPECIES: undecaprenyl-phosphate glucose phosphotransferase [Caballeronia]|jgi:Undecaprenyl-phosphate glucose phosphotransferase|uniref:Sugar transferase n=1 Tax=Caballeronia zhejiangensis TaxID=871203 RepID=A0A656QJM8_9BURK|nr:MULTISPECIES: undecaprenyl-phosphate glucose phosphotransferase [Caballeronia]EKS73218.1 undecaprenyl-phosphate glucose phosphotransferase [Burkholderia sp. SJ98]KDR28713.1 sugar transferase [Caballeronia zhejiangensis]MCI1046557.1 undecaprenyl-phosphate glucose phosphotransferase [Caballeronia zhejiangensis]MDR5765950.1 undecaprenyl-phosphate glucose phosphotransferase [Caballeronia sp. LZ028]MDR5786661.1 undecaprenyl-phosphate glucose phosphotransferase [Caballeronia sp. LP003]